MCNEAEPDASNPGAYTAPHLEIDMTTKERKAQQRADQNRRDKDALVWAAKNGIGTKPATFAERSRAPVRSEKGGALTRKRMARIAAR